jgi:hypothetical protein
MMIYPPLKTEPGKRRGRKGAPRVTNPDDDKRDDLLQKSDMNNQKFEAYYRKLLAMDDDEWSTFLDTCRESLPSTFRICGSRECVCPLFVHLCPRLTCVTLYQDGICAHLCSRENLHPESYWCHL